MNSFNMVFDCLWLQSFFKKKLPAPKKLAELLTEHSLEAKAVGKALDVSVSPARAGDCLCYQGLAREIGAVLGYRVHHPELSPKMNLSANEIKVAVHDQDACPRYMLVKWSGVTLANSTAEIQARLRSAGQRSINGAVDLVNYLMLEIGQPVHVFDADKVKGGLIEVRWARSGEVFVSLEDKRYRLSKDVLVIADAEGPLAVAGVKGGQRAEVTSETKNILVEAANFDSKVIRQVSRRLELKTDASWRFENGLDPNLAETAQRRLKILARKTFKPKSVKLVADVYPHRSKDKRISLDLSWVRQFLGDAIPTKQIRVILQRLDFQVKTISNRKMEVKVPSWRLDVKAKEDLAEEIGRLYGYKNIKALLPRTVLVSPHINRHRVWKRAIKDFLVQLGLNEAYLYSFISAGDFSLFGYSQKKAVELANPVSAHYQYMRFSLLPSLLRSVGENAKRFRRVEIFEMGKIFNRPDQEKEVLAGILFDRRSENEGFYEIKGVVESLLERLGITDAWFDDYQAKDYFGGSSTWHPAHRAEIKVGHQIVGFLGEIHPRIADQFSLGGPVFAFEIDLEKLIEFASDQQEYQPISPHPAVIRDLSVIVPEGTFIEEVIRTASSVGGELVRDVDLLDVYHDEELSGEKSLTLRITYQSLDKSLSAVEVGEIEKRIISNFQELNWRLCR